MASNYVYKYGRLDSREPAEDDSFGSSSSSDRYYAPSMPSSSSGVKSTASNGKPYLGMTGTGLNVWVTVACTTAMALFGKLSHESIYDAIANNLHTPGYDQGVFGGIIVTPDFLKQMGNPGPSLQGTIVSLYDIGWYVPLHVLRQSLCLQHLPVSLVLCRPSYSVKHARTIQLLITDLCIFTRRKRGQKENSHYRSYYHVDWGNFTNLRILCSTNDCGSAYNRCVY